MRSDSLAPLGISGPLTPLEDGIGATVARFRTLAAEGRLDSVGT